MEKAVYTHDEASRIIEFFEKILEENNIIIPGPEDDDREEDNVATLYGSVYGNLLDNVEEALIDIINRAKDSPVIPYEYSGTW